MVTAEQMLLAAGAALVFALVPGPAVIYVITRSTDQSRRAGIMSGLGVGVGNQVLVVMAAFGLSALLASSQIAYDVVKYVGAAYLVYLGIRRLYDRSVVTDIGTLEPMPIRTVFRQGVFVGLLNPKAALFFMSFLPQFVDRASGNTALQIVLLGTIVVGITFLSDVGYAVLASGVAQKVLRKPHVVRRQQLAAGLVYIGLGVAAALTGSASAGTT